MDWLDKAKLVFGDGLEGKNLKEYALYSSVKFVRSQDHLAVLGDWNSGAKGQILTAFEALDIFGIEKLLKAIDEKVIFIAHDIEEPARTFKERREKLGLEFSDITRYLEVSLEQLVNLEDPEFRSPISIINKVAQKLGLDDKRISLSNEQSGERLAIRLKTIAAESATRLSRKDILTLTEASWVIKRQTELVKLLKDKNELIWERVEKSSNYGSPGYPAWQHGYYLGGHLRKTLNIKGIEVPSLRGLCEGYFEIPLIQASLSPSIAGAILSVENCRGIVININGLNTSNVFSKRLTIAHELGHLLWDPDDFLEDLRLDEYSSFEQNWKELGDYVEQRANAFSVEFLAPQALVSKVYRQNGTGEQGLRSVVETFGISVTAAKYHLRNYGELVPNSNIQFRPSDHWLASENYMTDYFPIHETPSHKRGLFAGLVALAYKNNYISDCTAAHYLNTDIDTFKAQYGNVLDCYSEELKEFKI
ncbi:ImmA/IrrE family metallo-endopeptidase [Paenibacillus humicola]|uniref:ImmA/IrrE family metallo-endopeptidase n=1 Tax=Paenibacillus humicola TaxID=3110540 RepID=UPI00237A64F8|nr:ImmA/IrrE family metallo-endopeptidase [Paenibacillus humicola]